jgi:choline dehydrogenase-like flavoprotein
LTETITAEVVIIGSGAGGAVTAALLAEAGRDVLVLEEGPHLDPGAVAPYSQDEMVAKYRHGGVNATLGLPPISFVEGRCVGGGTEINSGLYHRPPEAIVDAWARSWSIADLEPAALTAHAAEIEQVLSVGPVPGGAPAASALIERGAKALGWNVTEVPRVFQHAESGPARQQTMTRTFIPRATAAGARLMADCRVDRLVRRHGRVTEVRCRVDDGAGRRLIVQPDTVFVCAGAIGTPALLQRSGIRGNVGRGLKLHPTVKLAAQFAEPLDDHGYVPMHQVKQFAPDITLGGSVFRSGYVALALGDSWPSNAPYMRDWRSMGVYYASIRSEGQGRVVAVPGLTAPLVTYRLTRADISRLARGMVHLAELLFEAGAVRLFPSIEGAPPIESRDQVARLWELVHPARVGLMTIHLFSTVGMGERRDITGADSFGRVWGVENLRVNDASLLPDAPGVNPQGTIMAIAMRNSRHFIDQT